MLPSPGPAPLRIEIVWVEQGGAIGRLPLQLPSGATLADALARLQGSEPGRALEEGRLKAAVFGRLLVPSTPLHDGDRIELLGELSVDPKIARQRRVAKKRAEQARDKWRGPLRKS
ncbi:MAG: RnfH family protein [Burkholderiales bacterium]|nr:RnfH family protein [Burkholderiales bacterium]